MDALCSCIQMSDYYYGREEEEDEVEAPGQKIGSEALRGENYF